MNFNFDFQKSKIYQAVKLEKVPIFLYGNFLTNLFFSLFIVFVGLWIFSLLGLFFENFVLFKVAILCLSLAFLFWDFYLFFQYKIKKPFLPASLLKVTENPQNYNLAEFLDFELGKIIHYTLKFCRKRNLPVDSTALFYWVLRTSKDIELIFVRLGINPQQLREMIKNHLEKTPPLPVNFKKESSLKFFNTSKPLIFSLDFKEVFLEALEIAKERKKERLTEKEILVALSRKNKLFQKILIDFDLKKEDVAHLTFWLDYYKTIVEYQKQFWRKERLARWGNIGRDWAAGYTITLDQFSINWTDIASRRLFRKIIGHEKEIDTVETILAKSEFSNALIIGEPGTGRKSIVEALAQRCYLGQSLPELNDRKIIELDLVSLISRIQDIEKLESTLDQIFAEVVMAGNIILVIDELHNYVGEKASSLGTVNISGILSKYLAIPDFKFVAITTYDGLHRSIEQNRSFLEFFRKVEVSEISEEQTIQILQNYALDFESKYKILITYPAIREIINLTARYLPTLPFPRKAIDILDESVVYLQTLKEKILLPHHIAKIISSKTEIPVGKIETKEKEILLNLENLIHQRIINQDEAVKEISIAMRRARVGIASKKRPMGSFLFLGPTGVGKTETSKALAQIYFGSEEKMIRLDMSEFQAISDIPRLIGGIGPVEIQGLLTTQVRENPFSLILLDEIEKAHPNILNLFLQVLDEGHITDGQGRKVVFTNTIIICTSNAGSDIIFEKVNAGEKVDKEELLSILFKRSIFKPEFVNRFDATVIFNPLTKQNLLDIAGLMLNSLKKNLSEKDIEFCITESLKEKIVELSYKPEFGAREMRRVVQDNIENIIAQALLLDKIKKGDRFEINPENFEIIQLPKE